MIKQEELINWVFFRWKAQIPARKLVYKTYNLSKKNRWTPYIYKITDIYAQVITGTPLFPEPKPSIFSMRFFIIDIHKLSSVQVIREVSCFHARSKIWIHGLMDCGWNGTIPMKYLWNPWIIPLVWSDDWWLMIDGVPICLMIIVYYDDKLMYNCRQVSTKWV